MWVFYLISLPLTVGMVISTPRYFAGPEVPHYVLLIVGYTWFCSLSVIILVPADIWAGFENAGDFTMKERLKTSLHVNFIFYVVVGFIGLFGLILVIMMHKNWSGGILGLAMACSNTYGLVTGAFLLGFGLSEIPKSIWTNTDQTTRQKVLSHKIAKKAVKLDEAHQELFKCCSSCSSNIQSYVKAGSFETLHECYRQYVNSNVYGRSVLQTTRRPLGEK